MGELLVLVDEDEEALEISVTDLAEEGWRHRVDQVLTLVLSGQSITKACRIVGVSKQTWYNWQRAGYLEKPITEMHRAFTSMAAQEILSNMSDYIATLSAIALGQPPPGSDMEVKPQHVITAFQTLSKYLTQAMDAADKPDNTEEVTKFLENYSPQTFQINQQNLTQLNFIYSGPPKPEGLDDDDDDV